jgi:hypothetical protein
MLSRVHLQALYLTVMLIGGGWREATAIGNYGNSHFELPRPPYQPPSKNADSGPFHVSWLRNEQDKSGIETPSTGYIRLLDFYEMNIRSLQLIAR